MLLRVFESFFGSESLCTEVKLFFGEQTSLFSPARHGRPSTARVAVTSAKDLGQTNCLITSYNYPLQDPRNLDEVKDGRESSPEEKKPWDTVEREEDPAKDIKVWEAAMATSAAPFYLPPFMKEETSTSYVDGAVYANCPARVAYSELEKLWPNGGAVLDMLVAAGTGQQDDKPAEMPTALNLGFLTSIRAMFQKQLNSNISWTEFQRAVPIEIRSRLHRLDPRIRGDRVELFEYKKMSNLQEQTAKWVSGDGAAYIQDTANTLIAKLFFFEPDEDQRPGAGADPRDPNYEYLRGSIRCRLGHSSSELDTLLRDKIASFWHTEVESADPSALATVAPENWNPCPGETSPAGMKKEEDGVMKFRVAHMFVVRRDSRMHQVLAVKLQKQDKMIALSGFPSALGELKRRARLRWLQ
jgi:hypothetical protein